MIDCIGVVIVEKIEACVCLLNLDPWNGIQFHQVNPSQMKTTSLHVMCNDLVCRLWPHTVSCQAEEQTQRCRLKQTLTNICNDETWCLTCLPHWEFNTWNICCNSPKGAEISLAHWWIDKSKRMVSNGWRFLCAHNQGRPHFVISLPCVHVTHKTHKKHIPDHLGTGV